LKIADAIIKSMDQIDYLVKKEQCIIKKCKSANDKAREKTKKKD
jgi:hypothetical protein